ncbi:hypothetical protein ACP4OV_022424 [Aristida adscensionis]
MKSRNPNSPSLAAGPSAKCRTGAALLAAARPLLRRAEGLPRQLVLLSMYPLGPDEG